MPHEASTEVDHLALLAQSGCRESLEEATKAVYRALLDVAHKYETGHAVEDLAQDMYVKLLKQLPNWNPDKASFIRFLYIIAHSVGLSHYRHQRAAKRDPGYTVANLDGIDVAGMAYEPASAMEKRDTYQEAVRRISQLPHIPRQILVSRMMGETIQSLASHHQTSRHHIKRNIALAIERLPAWLGDNIARYLNVEPLPEESNRSLLEASWKHGRSDEGHSAVGANEFTPSALSRV